MVRKCKHCDVPLTESTETNGTRLECRKCYNINRNTQRRKRKLEYQWEAIKLLGGTCYMCKKEATKDTMVCFDFHHINKETKEEGIASLLVQSRPLSAVLEEASKCILYCACCHRLHHQKHGY